MDYYESCFDEIKFVNENLLQCLTKKASDSYLFRIKVGNCNVIDMELEPKTIFFIQKMSQTPQLLKRRKENIKIACKVFGNIFSCHKKNSKKQYSYENRLYTIERLKLCFINWFVNLGHLESLDEL